MRLLRRTMRRMLNFNGLSRKLFDPELRFPVRPGKTAAAHAPLGLRDPHGRKNWLDHLIEVDPGSLAVEMASDYQERAPTVIAVMPFCDKGSANFTVDKVPVTFRNEQEQHKWAWTDSQTASPFGDGLSLPARIHGSQSNCS